MSNESGGLGSLSQSARAKELKTARWILIAIGVLSILANGAFLLFVDQMVDEQINEQLAQLRRDNMVVDEAAVEEYRAQAVRGTWLIMGVGVLLGVVFLGLGIAVHSYPVPCTVAGLVLYIGNIAVFGLMDPQNLARGWLIKILIIVALFKAVQAAIAYERESRELPQSYDAVPDKPESGWHEDAR